MTDENIIKKAHELGLMLRDTEEMRVADAAEAAFDDDADLQAKLAEYSAQQELLAKDTAGGDALAAAAVKGRVQALYDEITKSPRYIAFSEAQAAVQAIMSQVNDEINFAITGQRHECGGDCSGCHGCH